MNSDHNGSSTILLFLTQGILLLDLAGGALYWFYCSLRTYTDELFARICPGMKMALDALWMAIIHILLNFDLRQAIDENGVNIVPKRNFVPGTILSVRIAVY